MHKTPVGGDGKHIPLSILALQYADTVSLNVTTRGKRSGEGHVFFLDIEEVLEMLIMIR